MKKIHLITIMTLFVLGGCKTVRQTEKTNLQTNTAQNTTVKESSSSSMDIDSNFSKVEETIGKVETTDKGTVNETTVEETTTTNFSTPDSTGKQYPESQTKTKKTTIKGENKDLKVNQNVNSQSNQETQLRDRSDYKSDSTAVDKTKQQSSDKSELVATAETKTPGFVTVIAFVLALLGIALIYYLLKRYGVIK